MQHGAWSAGHGEAAHTHNQWHGEQRVCQPWSLNCLLLAWLPVMEQDTHCLPPEQSLSGHCKASRFWISSLVYNAYRSGASLTVLLVKV